MTKPYTLSDLGINSDEIIDLGKINTPGADRPMTIGDLGISPSEIADLAKPSDQINQPAALPPKPSSITGPTAPMKPGDIPITLPQPIQPGIYGEDIARQKQMEQQNKERLGEELPRGKDPTRYPIATGLNIASNIPQVGKGIAKAFDNPDLHFKMVENQINDEEKDGADPAYIAKRRTDLQKARTERQKTDELFQPVKNLATSATDNLTKAMRDAAETVAPMKEQADELSYLFKEVSASKPDLIPDLVNSVKLGKLDLLLDWYSAEVAARGDQASAEQMKRLATEYKATQDGAVKYGIVRETLKGVARMAPGLVGSMAVSSIPIVGPGVAFSGWALQGGGQVFREAVDAGVPIEKARTAALIAAPLYAAIENLQINFLKNIPVGENLGSIKKVVAKGLIDYLGDTFFEANEEGMQGIVTDLATEIAKGNTDKDYLGQVAWKSWKDNFGQSLASMAVVGFPAKARGIHQGIRDVQQNQRSNKDAPAAVTPAPLATPPAMLPTPQASAAPSQESSIPPSPQAAVEQVPAAAPTPGPAPAATTEQAPAAVPEAPKLPFNPSQFWAMPEAARQTVWATLTADEREAAFKAKQEQTVTPPAPAPAPAAAPVVQNIAKNDTESQITKPAPAKGVQPEQEKEGVTNKTVWQKTQEFIDELREKKPIPLFENEMKTDSDRGYARYIEKFFKQMPADLQEWWLRRPDYRDQETGEQISVLDDGVRGTHVYNARFNDDFFSNYQITEQPTNNQPQTKVAESGQEKQGEAAPINPQPSDATEAKALIDKGFVNLSKIRRGKTTLYSLSNGIGNQQDFPVNSPVIEYFKYLNPEKIIPQSAQEISNNAELSDDQRGAIDALIKKGFKYATLITKKFSSKAKGGKKEQVWKIFNDVGQTLYVPVNQGRIIDYLKAKGNPEKQPQIPIPAKNQEPATQQIETPKEPASKAPVSAPETTPRYSIIQRDDGYMVRDNQEKRDVMVTADEERAMDAVSDLNSGRPIRQPAEPAPTKTKTQEPQQPEELKTAAINISKGGIKAVPDETKPQPVEEKKNIPEQEPVKSPAEASAPSPQAEPALPPKTLKEKAREIFEEKQRKRAEVADLQEKKKAALQRAQEAAKKLGESFSKRDPNTLYMIGTEQAQLAFEVVSSLVEAGYYDFKSMAIQLNDMVKDYIGIKGFQEAIEDAYDSYAESSDLVGKRKEQETIESVLKPENTTETSKQEQPEQVKEPSKTDESTIVNPIDQNASDEEKANQLLSLSKENEPIIDRALKRVDSELGTKSKWSYKEKEKIINKGRRPSIRKKKPWFRVEHVRDSFRFKTVITSFDDISKAIQIIMEETDAQIVKPDFSKMMTPLEWGWRFVGFDLRMPNGQLVEYYMPFKELDAKETKGPNHDLFEKWRELPEDQRLARREEYVKDLNTSWNRYQAAWNNALSRLGMDENAALASFNRAKDSVEGFMLSPTRRKLSLRSSADGEPTAHLPPSRINEPSSQETQTRPSESSLETNQLPTIESPSVNSSINIHENNADVNKKDLTKEIKSSIFTIKEQNNINASEGVLSHAEHRTGETSLEGREPEAIRGAREERETGTASQGEVRGGEPDLRESDIGGRPGVPGGEGNVNGGPVPTASGGRDLAEDNARATAAHDYLISNDDNLGAGGPKQKFRDNIAAIRTLKTIEAEGRRATPEEQKILVKYIGWGMFPQVFGKDVDPKWEKEAKELRSLLTPDELTAANRSILNAHYSQTTIIQFMWNALRRMGFNGGKVMEPAVGVGHFFGLRPKNLNYTMSGIDLDVVSGKIAKNLYQSADIKIQGYETVPLQENTHDLMISNVPFASVRPFDKDSKKYGIEPRSLSLHDFYFVKSLYGTRPGGMVAFITSRYTMDKVDSTVRRKIAETADFIGAVRLPNTAFKGNAGTEVVTDIIFLKKREPGQQMSDLTRDFLELRPIGLENKEGERSDVNINKYYIDHPEMVVGAQSLEGSMYSQNEYTVYLPEDKIARDLNKVLNEFPENILLPVEKNENDMADAMERVTAPSATSVGSYFVRKGKVYTKTDLFGKAQPAGIDDKDAPRTKALITFKNIFRKVFARQLKNQGQPSQIDLRRLSNVYEAFVKSHGAVHLPKNVSIIENDADLACLLALEKWDNETKKATKSAFLEGKLAVERDASVKIESVEDAYIAALARTGSINVPMIKELMGGNKDDTEIVQDLLEKNIVFLDHEAAQGSDEYVSREEYLSGDVRKKLREVTELAKTDNRFARNVSELEKVQPRPKGPGEITVLINSPILDAKDIKHFANKKFGYYELGSDISVQHDTLSGKWTVSTQKERRHYNNNSNEGVKFSSDSDREGSIAWYGTDILETILNNETLQVRYNAGTSENPNWRVDEKATIVLREKADRLKDEFKQWVWEDGDRATRLVSVYNDVFNNIAERKYVHPLRIKNPDIKIKLFGGTFNLRANQADAVWRVLQSKNVMLAHGVGAGKTAIITASAMEMRRLGTRRKNLIVVPNHMIPQWQSEILAQYPGARILAATSTNFDSATARREFLNKAAIGDYDIILMRYSHFKMVSISPALESEFVNNRLAQYREALERVIAAEEESAQKQYGRRRGSGKRKPSRGEKYLQKRIENMQARLRELMQMKRDTGFPYFDEMGFDQMFVDEADNFKNLDFATGIQNILGLGDQKGSEQALDMHMKVQYIQRLGGGVVFATGTPISNSLAEAYHMMRFLQPKELDKLNLGCFDEWQRMFAEPVTSWEMNASGTGLKQRTRFSKFNNIQELTRILRQAWDVMTSEMLEDRGILRKGHELPLVKRETIQSNATPLLLEYLDHLGEREKDIEARMGPPKNGDDIHLAVMSHGRLASVDMRLIHPSLPDENGSKLNRTIERVQTLYNDYPGTTGVIFYDMTRPRGPGEKMFDVYAEIKKKLVKAGIPAKEIAFIHDFNTDAKKLQLFSDMNAGKVRVLIGNTQKLGAGSNIQKKLKWLIHVDGPNRPRDVIQREGRIIRQGNTNKEVIIGTSISKGSHDQTVWEMLQRKARMIDDIISGDDLQTNSIEDEDVFADASIAAIGSPLMTQRAEIKDKVKKLEAKIEAEQNAQFFAKGAIELNKEAISRNIDWIETQQELEKTAGPKPDENKTRITLPDGTKITDRSKAIKYIVDWFEGSDNTRDLRWKTKNLFKFGGVDVGFRTNSDGYLKIILDNGIRTMELYAPGPTSYYLSKAEEFLWKQAEEVVLTKAFIKRKENENKTYDKKLKEDLTPIREELSLERTRLKQVEQDIAADAKKKAQEKENTQKSGFDFYQLEADRKRLAKDDEGDADNPETERNNIIAEAKQRFEEEKAKKEGKIIPPDNVEPVKVTIDNPELELAFPDYYWIHSVKTKKFERKRLAKKVEIPEIKGDFFIYKNDKTWIVSESKTGSSLGTGATQNKAIAEVTGRLYTVGQENVDLAISRGIKADGLSPRYRLKGEEQASAPNEAPPAMLLGEGSTTPENDNFPNLRDTVIGQMDDVLSMLPADTKGKINLKFQRSFDVRGRQYGTDGDWEMAVWQNPDTGEINVFINPDIPADRIALGLRHELVGHIGSRIVYAANPEIYAKMRAYFDSLRAANDPSVKRLESRYRKEIGADTDRLFDEWTAQQLHGYLNENKRDSIATRIYNYFRGMLVKLGLVKEKIDDVLRVILEKMRESSIPTLADHVAFEKNTVNSNDKGDIEKVFADAVKDKRTTFQRLFHTEKSFRKYKDQIAAEMLVPISTRLKKLDAHLKEALRKYEFNWMVQQHKDEKATAPWLQGIKKMTPDDRVILDLALKNSAAEKVAELVKKYNLEKQWEAVRRVLDDIHFRSIKAGFDINYVREYYPRHVINPEGLLKEVGSMQEYDKIQQLWKRESDKLDRPLTEYEKASIVNSLIARPEREINAPGMLKKRSITLINKDLDKYYDYSPSALLYYIHEMNQAIEQRKFFKLDITEDELWAEKGQNREGSIINDITGGINRYVMDAIRDHKLSDEQQDELIGILKARFGYRPSGNTVQTIKNLAYMTSMGSGFSSAFSQIGDFAWAYYIANPVRASRALGMAIVGRSEIKKGDLGLDRIAEEFSTTRGLGKILNFIFDKTLMTRFDNLGKEAFINGLLAKYRDEAKKGDGKLLDLLKFTFGDKSDMVLSDLTQGKVTEEIKYLLFTRLLDFQPVAQSEMPALYLKAPNGRILYMLKTFTIKQLDVFRNEALSEIRAGIQGGDRGRIIKGLRNLIYLIGLFILANAGADEIKDFIFRRSVSFSDKVWDNILRLFGLSRFIAWEIRRTGNLGMAAAKIVMPPMDITSAPLHDISTILQDDGKSIGSKIRNAETWKLIPFFGKHYYWWFGGGRESQIKRSDKNNPIETYEREIRKLSKERDGAGSKIKAYYDAHRAEIEEFKTTPEYKEYIDRKIDAKKERAAAAK